MKFDIQACLVKLAMKILKETWGLILLFNMTEQCVFLVENEMNKFVPPFYITCNIAFIVHVVLAP